VAERLRQVAAYRDRYGIEGSSPLGPEPSGADATQRNHYMALSAEVGRALSDDSQMSIDAETVAARRCSAGTPSM
jgi:hypothetical protein